MTGKGLGQGRMMVNSEKVVVVSGSTWTFSTLAAGGPWRHQAMKVRMSLSGPVTTASTSPAAVFFIQPVRESSMALFLALAR